MKVKSESEVAQSCPTLCDHTDCSLPGSSIHGISQERVLEWVAIAFSECTMEWTQSNQDWKDKKYRKSYNSSLEWVNKNLQYHFYGKWIQLTFEAEFSTFPYKE